MISTIAQITRSYKPIFTPLVAGGPEIPHQNQVTSQPYATRLRVHQVFYNPKKNTAKRKPKIIQ